MPLVRGQHLCGLKSETSVGTGYEESFPRLVLDLRLIPIFGGEHVTERCRGCRIAVKRRTVTERGREQGASPFGKAQHMSKKTGGDNQVAVNLFDPRSDKAGVAREAT